MKRMIAAAAAAVGLLTSQPAQAVEVVHTEEASLNVEGRLQMVGHIERLDDAYRDENRMYLFLRQARLGVSGSVSQVKYKLTMGFAGEDEARAPSPGVSLGLLDMYADVPLRFAGEHSYLRIGQFKTPYGLERLADPGELAFTDRSIQNLALRLGRDIGLAFHTRQGGFIAAAGVFAGGGRDVPERYLPQVLGVPLLTARVGYDTGIYDNAFAELRNEAPAGIRFAVGANAAYTRDSRVGHSTVSNVRLGERSLLINTAWNPYIAQAPMEPGEIWQTGLDGAVRIPAGPGMAKAEAEVGYGEYSNEYGVLGIGAARVQTGYEYGRFEANIRYAVVKPDAKMANSGVSITKGLPYHEITPALAVNLPYSMRLVADMPILLKAPVVTEPNVGAYVLTTQPDQASILKSGTVARQDVLTARLMFQASF